MGEGGVGGNCYYSTFCMLEIYMSMPSSIIPAMVLIIYMEKQNQKLETVILTARFIHQNSEPERDMFRALKLFEPSPNPFKECKQHVEKYNPSSFEPSDVSRSAIFVFT